MAGENWYYTSGGQQVGPVGINDIQAQIAAGQLTAQDHVWRDGMANWLPIASVPELAGYAGGAANPYQQQQQYPAQGGYAANPYGGQPLGYGGYQAPYSQPRQGAYSGKATTA